MPPKTGIDWLDAIIDHDAPKPPDPSSRRDVRYALDHGFELEEALWMLDLTDRKPDDERPADAISGPERAVRR